MSRRISPNRSSRARKCLFPDANTESSIDNETNKIKEDLTRERKHMSQKWGFDFENDVPLDGDYEWIPCDGSFAWIGERKNGSKRDKTEDLEEELPVKEDNVSMKIRNEMTPNPSKEENDKNLLVRKRRMEDGRAAVDNTIKRKISF